MSGFERAGSDRRFGSVGIGIRVGGSAPIGSGFVIISDPEVEVPPRAGSVVPNGVIGSFGGVKLVVGVGGICVISANASGERRKWAELGGTHLPQRRLECWEGIGAAVSCLTGPVRGVSVDESAEVEEVGGGRKWCFLRGTRRRRRKRGLLGVR